MTTNTQQTRGWPQRDLKKQLAAAMCATALAGIVAGVSVWRAGSHEAHSREQATVASSEPAGLKVPAAAAAVRGSAPSPSFYMAVTPAQAAAVRLLDPGGSIFTINSPEDEFKAGSVINDVSYQRWIAGASPVYVFDLRRLDASHTGASEFSGVSAGSVTASPSPYYMVGDQNAAARIDAAIRLDEPDFRASTGHDFDYRIAVIQSPEDERALRQEVGDANKVAPAIDRPGFQLIDLRAP